LPATPFTTVWTNADAGGDYPALPEDSCANFTDHDPTKHGQVSRPAGGVAPFGQTDSCDKDHPVYCYRPSTQ
jgi:hypothetical protein